jgi:hypothetical protein
MKHFGEKDLIAYHLHELSPRRERALERALQANPALLAESDAYASTLRDFKRGAAPLAVDAAVLARNWSALRPSLAAYRLPVAAPFGWRLPALAGVGLAAVAATVFVAIHHHAFMPGPQSAAVIPSSSVVASGSVMPSSEAGAATSPVAGSALLAKNPLVEERGFAGEGRRAVISFARPQVDGQQDVSPRRITSLPLAEERPPVLHFIPLAPVPVPAFAATASRPVTVEPGAAVHAVGVAASSKSGHGRISIRHEHITDLTLAMGGTFIVTRDATGSSTGAGSGSEGATHAVAAIAAFHQQLRPAIGYRIEASYTAPDFGYGYKSSNSFGTVGYINGRVYELAGTYVVQGPHRGRLSSSAEAGGGLMAFLPAQKSAYTSYNLRGAAVLGVAANVALTKHLSLHAAYRAQAFKGPDFEYSFFGSAIPVTTTLFSQEPSLGITYRFSHD